MTTKQVGCSFRRTEVDSKVDVETGALLRGLELLFIQQCLIFTCASRRCGIQGQVRQGSHMVVMDLWLGTEVFKSASLGSNGCHSRATDVLLLDPVSRLFKAGFFSNTFVPD